MHSDNEVAGTRPPRVSVIVPCRNEVCYIRRFLEQLFQQTANRDFGVEVLVADGRSDDGTRAVLCEYEGKHPSLRVLDNPELTVAAGLNRAIREAAGSIIVRMDAHTRYAPDYIAQCVAALEASGADNVGGPWVAEGDNYVSRAVALVFDSPLVSGGGKAHAKSYEGPVDTVYLGCWRKEAFEQYGVYDESLVRSQDNELNLRIVRNGGRVWQTPRIQSWYTPRGTIGSLFKQYVQYGYWKARVIKKHRLPASVRQLVPGGFLAALVTLAAASPWSGAARGLLLVALATYAAAVVMATLAACRTRKALRFAPVLPCVFGALHFGFGYGFLRGVLDFHLLRRDGNPAFASLTRSSQAT